MTSPQPSTPGDAFLGRAVEATIRIGLVVALVAWCFYIVRPFVVPVAWALIIAVAVHPAYRWLRGALGGRRRLAAALIVLLGLLLLVAPTVMLGGTLVEGAQVLGSGFREGRLVVPPPPASVAEWPLIGGRLDEFWSRASQNLDSVLRALEPQIVAFGKWLVAKAAGVGFAFLLSLLSVLIAGVLLANDAAGRRAMDEIVRRLAGERGAEFADLASATVRSVAVGILGVAVVQALLAGLGFLVVGVPGAGLWALLCLILSVVQVGTFPVMLPVVIYVFSTAEPIPAVAFAIWSVFVGFVDNLLKPLVLGRGVRVPTVVIFLGAIGGFLTSGIIGLFVGAVVLVLGYTLFLAWVRGPQAPSQEA